ncbi:MAG: DUF2281 domain-containing protein [bacterium]|nr:DUF2281 domain-containing protein [bacterium]
MTAHEFAIAKINQLPEPLVQEVSDFIDFLLVKQDQARWQLWNQFSEAQALADSDIGDYGKNLSEYEECLARGEIRW